ncbi:MAG TPA: DNA methyltransferase [Polyangia bacterium]
MKFSPGGGAKPEKRRPRPSDRVTIERKAPRFPSDGQLSAKNVTSSRHGAPSYGASSPKGAPSKNPTPPRIPRQRRAFSTVGGAIETSGDPEEAGALARLWNVDPGLARALTHGFHAYAGRLHPSIGRGAIMRWSRPGDTVVDPFCGSGTVLTEAMGLGRVALGVDASPLGIAIAETRTTLLDDAKRTALVNEARRIAEDAGEDARKRRRPELPTWAGPEFERFFPHVAFELFALRALVMEVPRQPIGQALRMCFSSNLVKLMKAGPEAPRDGEAKRIARGVPSRLLADRAVELASGLSALEHRTPPGTPAPVIKLGDARDLKGIAKGAARLIVSSPPYAGTYDYAAQHDVRFAWLELPRRSFESAQLGARTPGAGRLGADPSTWRASQLQWMREMARILAPGGHALLIVGDGVVGNEPEDAPTTVAELAEQVGLSPVARASQVRATHDRRLREIFKGKPRQEHLLLLRRT